MTMRQNKATFFCVPIALGLPLISCAVTSIHVYIALWIVHIDPDAVDVSVLFSVSSLFLMLLTGFTFSTAIWRVRLQDDAVVCKGWLPRHTFSLEYEKCTVGMDWHLQNGNKIWWIYLCYGYKPSYKSKNPAKRINALKCKPGFIRIMYRDEVYQALMSVLPKKQAGELEASLKFAGFRQQGRII